MIEQDIINEIMDCFSLKIDIKGLQFLEKRIIALEEENKQLKSKLEHCIPKTEHVEMLRIKNKRLQQLESVIDEVIKVLDDLNIKMLIISDSDYVYNQDEIYNIVFKYQKEILEILKK